MQLRTPLVRIARALALALSACAAAAPAPAQSQAAQEPHHVLTVHGDRQDGYFGSAVIGGLVRAKGLDGDFDADGVADILVGAPNDQALPNDHTGMVRAYSGKTGAVLWTIRGGRGDRFGASVAFLGDITGDGVSDFAVGAWAGERSAATDREGYVELWQGDRLAPKRISGARFYGGTTGDYFGETMISTPDLDADGFRDLFVGGNQNGSGTGYARAISSKKQVVLFTVSGTYRTGTDGVFGSALAAGDLDGDGTPELLIGAHGEPRSASITHAGRVYAVTNTGQPISVFEGTTVSENLGHALAILDTDIDQNGWKDVAVGVVGVNGQAGELRVVDMKSRKQLATLPGVTTQKDRMGACLASVADIDGDKVGDLLVGTAPSGNRHGYVVLVSGATLRPIPGGKFDGDAAYDAFGTAIAALEDINGDGKPELCVGARNDDDGGRDAGSVRVLSSRAQRLTSDVHEVELRRGGQQLLRLDVGAAHAGQLYLVVGTMSGTTPGIRLGSSVLPINPDAYFDITIQFANDVMLRHSRRLLDAQGRATAYFTSVPEIPRSLVGRTMHHAAVVFGTSGLVTTNAVPLSLR